ncbi:hypothetical protein M011DRAFT_410538 [Sporormia fimetaria CBS 119925]|uniref:DUF8035 domain-containing protein n=1 Tax=Sporormia fimetaria CBS 119925 TaxID=1340428 RepID=A0A6A6V2J7_9PLEO|nr:hypothetical protein M011DRAFT_410538 [Sporormia fimetaria CBS 119925]
MSYRASTGDLSFIDDHPSRGGQRWDRDRFERVRGRGPPPSHDHYRYSEHEKGPGFHRDVDIHADYNRRAPLVAERDRFDEPRYGRPRRRTELFDDPTPSEMANVALTPYRRKSVVEKELDVAIRRPARPGYTRRQSSLDTFDRRPLPRYHEYDRDEWRPPTNVDIPLPIRERRSSPRRFRERDDDFEEIRYREYERERERDQEYREVEVRREKSTRRARSRSRAARSIAATSVRSSSTSSFEEIAPPRAVMGKKGKTRMPKRLVKKQAIIDLGYPFEEEDDFIIVRRALEKEQIDEIIRISENYKEGTCVHTCKIIPLANIVPEKTTYVFADKAETVVEVAPPPPPPPMAAQSVHYAQSVRTASPPRHSHEVYEERVEESNHIGGPLTVLIPEEQRRAEQEDTPTERELKEQIRALEAERRLMKYEREGDYEVVERVERREPKREVIRVEKDRKVRREPNPKVVAAMLATLT